MSYQPPEGVRTKPPEGVRTINVQIQCFPELLGTLQTLTLSGGALFLLVRTQGAHMLKKDNNRS